MKSFLSIVFIFFVLLLLAVPGVYGIFRWLETPPPPITAEASLEYYRDSFTLLAHDAEGIPILMQMDFSRKAKDGRFIHYYDGNLWYGEREQEFKTQFYAEETSVQSHDYLNDFKSTAFPDLSARQNHELTLESDFGELSFSVDTEGDFLTKNTLDYTRFASAAQTTLSLGSESFPAEIVWESAYSADYTTSVFFEGRGDLESQTHLFTLWDEDGNFYHIDQTSVESDQPNYASHTWVLYKDAATQSLQKSFTATITVNENGAQIDLPEWSTSINLVAPAPWIQGTLITEDGETRSIEGYFKNVKY